MLFSDVSFVRSDLLTKKDIAFQRCLFCSFGLLTKKDIAFQRCLFCSFGLLTKKDIAFQRCLFWVPDGTRTHDIQNHNLTL